MKADPKAQAAAAPKGSNKKLVTIIALALLVVGAGGAAWYFMQPQAEGAGRKAVKAEAPEYVPIESFTVNLQPENGDQYLQIAFTLQVPSQKDGDVIKANMAMVRSRMLLLLSGKKPSEIATVEGKRHLAREIVATLKQPFAAKGDPQQISDVLYTAFIIQ
jgi:flagellar FliL protein